MEPSVESSRESIRLPTLKDVLGGVRSSNNLPYMDDRSAQEGLELALQLASNAKLGVQDTNSRVHTERDQSDQIDLMVILGDTPCAKRMISCLSHAAHIYDDFVDPPECADHRARYQLYRDNFREYRKQADPLCCFVDLLCSYARDEVAAEKTFARQAAAALVIHSQGLEREENLKAYQRLALKGVSGEVAADLKQITPLVYSFTSKATQEIIEAASSAPDLTQSELWTVAYTPALLVHDYETEKARQELPADFELNHHLATLVQMVEISTKWIHGYSSLPEARVVQLQSIVRSFTPVFRQALKDPDPLLRSYQSLIDLTVQKLAKG